MNEELKSLVKEVEQLGRIPLSWPYNFHAQLMVVLKKIVEKLDEADKK